MMRKWILRTTAAMAATAGLVAGLRYGRGKYQAYLADEQARYQARHLGEQDDEREASQ
jgi:hypothetical protein